MSSTDPRYAALTVSNVNVLVTDNDPEFPAFTLPFAFGGAWSPLPSGMQGTGVGTYSTSLGSDTGTGSCKFDDTNDRLVVAFSSSPSFLGYRLKGQPGSGTLTSGTFTVEESIDGSTWSPVRTIANKNNTDEAFTDTLLASTRFIAFKYQTKSSGNLQFDMLTIGAMSIGWQAWLTSSGLSGEAAGENADPDHDGIPNVIEYVLGTNALNDPSLNSPSASASGLDLVFNFTRSDISEIDTVLAVEWSSDLIVWNPIPIGAVSSAGAQVEERGTDTDLITVSIPESNAQAGKLFARLKVTKH